MKLPSLDAEFNAESEYLIRFASKSVLTHENFKLRGRFFYNSLIFRVFLLWQRFSRDMDMIFGLSVKFGKHQFCRIQKMSIANLSIKFVEKKFVDSTNLNSKFVDVDKFC
jgi:hypothetical protein